MSVKKYTTKQAKQVLVKGDKYPEMLQQIK